MSRRESAEELRRRLHETKSDNEKAITHHRIALEEETVAKELRLHQMFNTQNRALDIIVSLRPEIPITPPLPFPFTLEEKCHGPLRAGSRLFPLTRDTFGVKSDDDICEFAYLPERNESIFLRRRNDLLEGYHYLGKPVVIAPEGGEASETEDLITLAPLPVGVPEKAYARHIYRDADGVIQHHREIYCGESDSFETLHHFNGVPWRLTEKYQGDYVDLIFENLHKPETRRYVIRGNASSYFMLENEIFAVINRGYYESFLIMRCSNGEKHDTRQHRDALIDCGSYAVTVTKWGKERYLVYYVAVPTPRVALFDVRHLPLVPVREEI